jgi:hypothetical protein
MVWAGSPFARLIEFGTGSPVGAISYQVLGNDGSAVHSGSVTPEAGAVSQLLVIDAAHNTVSKPLFEMRTLTWNYTTATGVVSDRVTYRVDRSLPFTVSAEGVRTKLGVSEHELPDEDVDLVKGYAEFQTRAPADALATAATSGDRDALLCVDAIEALAALAILPSLQLRATQRESSGTNEYSRFGGIDWDKLQLGLSGLVAIALDALDPVFGQNELGGFIFGTAPRSPDAITGA